MDGFLRGLFVVLLGFCGLGVVGQVTLFEDDFNRAPGANLDGSWDLQDALTGAGDARFWQISPDGASNDLRISDNNGLLYSDGTVAGLDKVVYVEVDATGYESINISFSYLLNSKSEAADAFTPGNEIQNLDVASLVYSQNLAGAWTEVDTYMTSGGTVTNEAIGASNGVIYIGFRIVCDDADGVQVGLEDDGLNDQRFIIDDVVIEGTAILPDEGDWYLTADGLDPTDITNWISDDEEAGSVNSSFTNPLNTFNIEVATFLLGVLQAPAPAEVDLGSNWTVSNVVVPVGSTLRNNSTNGYNLILSGTIDVAGDYEHHSKNNSGKTTDFPFDKLVGDELTGTITLFSEPSFANTWDLTKSLDWSGSGIVINNGEWEISGGSSFQLDVSEISSVNVNAFVKVTEDATFMKINDAISLPAGVVDFFQTTSPSATSGFKLGDITLTGEINIDANMAFSIEGTSMTMADNAIVNWHSKDGVDFVNPLEIVEENPGGGSGFALVENMVLESGDDLDILVPISLEGGSETITLETGSKLVLREGTINDLTVEGTSEFRIVTPQAGTLQHDDIFIEAGGLMICENGSSLTQNSGVITINQGASAFTQGGSLVDLNTAGTSYPGGAPTIAIGNNVGWTDWSQYTYWSSPIQGGAVGTVTNAVAYYEYTDHEEGDAGWVAKTGNFDDATGVAIQQAGGDNIVFTGVANSGNLTGPSAGIGTGTESWTFAGNPYPSAIHAGEFVGNFTNSLTIAGAIYVWDQASFSGTWGFASTDYTTINGVGVTGPNTAGYPGDIDEYWIAPFQGFFVDGTTGAINDLEFTNSMRDPTAGGTYENTFKSAGPKKMWLSLEEWNVTTPKHTETLLGFLEEASPEWDRLYDARQNNGEFRIGSLVYEYDTLGNAVKGQDAVIQGLPEFTGDEVIDLVLGIDVAGAYELDIMKHLNFDNQEVWIHDPTIDVNHLLSQQPFIFQVNEAGEYPIQLMFKEPGVVGIAEKVVPRALELNNNGGLWESNINGSYSVFNLAGQNMERGEVLANKPFAIKSNQGFISFVSEDGQHQKYLLR